MFGWRKFYALVLFFLPFSFHLLNAQAFDLSDFRLTGDAKVIDDRCIRLTEAVDWQSGSLWYIQPIDLSKPLVMQLDLFLGCQDDAGADGLVFVFQPSPERLGYAGEGMGFAGVVPSLGIEIDTWENEHLGDPAEDHVAILANGRVGHYSNLVGPNRIANIEDCAEHAVTIQWDPASNNLSLGIDGKVVASYTADIINEIFRGKSTVYWGVTAATGQWNNRHELCIDKLSLLNELDGMDFEPQLRKQLLKGEIVALEELQYASGSSDLLEDSFSELDRLVRLMGQHPDLALEIFGHTDNVGNAGANQRLSEDRAESVAQYLISQGIEADRVYHRGFGEKYPLASNNSPAGRSKNRRVEIHLFVPVP